MLYIPPLSRVIVLNIEAGLLTSGMNIELNDNNIEPVDYEPL